jgi:hypothetical protein
MLPDGFTGTLEKGHICRHDNFANLKKNPFPERFMIPEGECRFTENDTLPRETISTRGISPGPGK